MWMKQPRLLAAVLISIAVIRIASTFTVFSFTTDEPVHIGAGLELLQQHTYTLQRVNPPLPRIVIAALPTLAGMKWPHEGGFYERADQTLFSDSHYKTKLVLCRIGNLLFFILAAMALFAWARREAGDSAAVIATLLFTTQPILLGYAGIANHDVPAVTGLAVALLALSKWLDRPDARHAALLGAAYGFSALTKFSCIGYVPVACGAIWIVRKLMQRSSKPSAGEGAPLNITILIVPIVAAFVVWAGYAFTVEPLIDGIRGIMEFERQGFVSFAFGRTTTEGWWWYFPATVGLKTTLPFLILFALGGHVAWRSRFRRVYAEGTAAALAILATAMSSTLDLGIRYVLPLYVPLTLATAVVVIAAVEQRQRWIRFAAIAMVALHVAASIAAHPDYFPYFNILAGREPGACLVDSNLDWGQDNLRLKTAARRLHIDRIGLAIPGNRTSSAEFNAIGLPRNYRIDPFRPRAGWLALGEHFYRIDRAGWRWLDAFPMQRIGTSVRLYHVPKESVGAEESLDVEQVLLPLAGTPAVQAGARWRVDQTITNHGAADVHLARTNCQGAAACELEVKSGQSVRIVGSDAVRPFVYVSVPRRAIDSIAFTTVARRVDPNIPGSDVVVPAVRESEFRDGPIVIDSVPFSQTDRLNLRLYIEERGLSQNADVILRDGERVVAQRVVPIYMTGYFTHGDFSALFPEVRAAGRKLEVTIDAHARAWAFLTATDAAERSTVHLPK